MGGVPKRLRGIVLPRTEFIAFDTPHSVTTLNAVEMEIVKVNYQDVDRDQVEVVWLDDRGKRYMLRASTQLARRMCRAVLREIVNTTGAWRSDGREEE